MKRKIFYKDVRIIKTTVKIFYYICKLHLILYDYRYKLSIKHKKVFLMIM